ncbi:ABC transporter ATP-binding protein [Nocardia sp. NPDC058633]|uniref:ABC transporter ATP-binding protein n=1 Tax=Nocardia sp. NPDC058633 TaxID=3346568 RepID=UPI0036682CF9
MTLHAEGIGWTRGGQPVLNGVSVSPERGETIGLLGPNGSGKSSLLRLLAGIDRPDDGRVLLDNTDLRALRRRQVARRVAVVDQHADTELDITVREVVRLGRIPHGGVFGGDESADRTSVERAMEDTGIAGHAERRWHTLSGGERQRAQIARALAQDPDELLLDEPTNHLDIQHQLEILALVAALPLTSYIALHDLNLAAMYCDRVVVLDRGRVVAVGTAAEVITAELVEQVYRVRATVVVDPVVGYPTVTYRPSRLPSSPATSVGASPR